MTDLLLLLSVIAVTVVVSTGALRFGAPLARLPVPKLWQAGLAVFLAAAATCMLLALGWWLARVGAVAWYLPVLVVFALSPLAALLTLRLTAYQSWWEALRGLVLISAGCGFGFGYAAVLFSVQMQAFCIPTNGMAPTIVGRHFRGTCTACGGETIISVRGIGPRGPAPFEDGICSRCRKFGPTELASTVPGWPDRIIVRRCATVRRWDVIVFRFPPNPEQLYCQRVVALPGESIEIRAGAILINGNELVPPPEIAGWRWEMREVPHFGDMYAINGQPLQLANNQYFTLGDNSQSSYDSRFWGPVPAENIVGRAAWVYFPPRDWKAIPGHD